MNTEETNAPAPKSRVLRAFAFDPSLTLQFATSAINEIQIEVPWNFDDDGNPKPMQAVDQKGKKFWVTGGMNPGPENEYIKVVDFDAASGLIYPRVDLNQPVLLYSGGLQPSEKNPQFHQQMVFAVAMKSVHYFEEALGRKAFWAPVVQRNALGDIVGKKRFALQLRIYPHAMREQNAFYSPETLSVRFGYFRVAPTDCDPEEAGASKSKPKPKNKSIKQQLPRVGMVYSCLSHGIVAHEMTHALLDGVHPGFNYRTNGDVDAFHEAFADLVALFQHFTYPNIVRHQIAKTQGDLRKHNLLGMLAYDFGQATGRPGALRDALGTVVDGEWQPREADVTELKRTFEPHARGSILVAAVFDAFRAIYESRIQDLRRIATGGTGKLPDGDIHPDLVQRMTAEATNTAKHFLQLCIRALDYCPPVDLNFGDYMRALITADYDYFPSDERNYRTAIIESFRKYGVYPRDVRSLLIDGLLWWTQDEYDHKLWKDVVKKMSFEPKDRAEREVTKDARLNEIRDTLGYAKNITKYINAWIRGAAANPGTMDYWSECLYLAMGPRKLADYQTIRHRGKRPLFDVQSVRPTQRVGESSEIRTDVIIQIVQNRRGYLDPAVQKRADAGKRVAKPDFIFPAGCTIIVDPIAAKPRYIIAKDVVSEPRLAEVRNYVARQKAMAKEAAEARQGSLQNTFFGIAQRQPQETEPFAMLHRISAEPEVKVWR